MGNGQEAEIEMNRITLEYRKGSTIDASQSFKVCFSDVSHWLASKAIEPSPSMCESCPVCQPRSERERGKGK